MFIRIFPLPTASAQEREAFYIENRVIEDLPVRYESPFSDGEVLSHRRIERALGKGTEYSYACKETQQLFHVEAYDNPDQLTLPEAFAQADLGDMHDPHFATHLSIGGREAWLLHERWPLRMTDRSSLPRFLGFPMMKNKQEHLWTACSECRFLQAFSCFSPAFFLVRLTAFAKKSIFYFSR